MVVVFVLSAAIASVRCKAGYDLQFTNEDNSQWYFVTRVSWITHFYDYYPVHMVVANGKCGDYFTVDGYVKMYDTSLTDGGHRDAMKDYNDLRSLLLQIYPNCEATVWDETVKNNEEAIIQFKVCDGMKSVKKG